MHRAEANAKNYREAEVAKLAALEAQKRAEKQLQNAERQLALHMAKDERVQELKRTASTAISNKNEAECVSQQLMETLEQVQGDRDIWMERYIS